jgi:hypothetical protein
MFEGITKRDIVISLIATVVATALTIFGVNYVLRKFMLDDPNDPLTHQGGLSPQQQIGR